MKVELRSAGRGGDSLLGVIELAGAGLRCRPDSPALREIAETPIREHRTGRAITPQDDPEAFLANLRYTYRSAYLRATEPME